MTARSVLAAIGRFVAIALLLEIALVALVGLICLVAGWHTLEAFARGLVFGGVLALVVGMAGLVSDIRLIHSPFIRFSQHAFGAVTDRLGERRRGVSGELAFTLLMAVVGLGAVAISLVIQSSLP